MENTISEGTFVHADLNTTKTVLRNLLSNAIKFTPFDGKILVNAKLGEENIIIEVQDNGQGIPPEDISKILNPNEHFSKLGTDKEPGTGLGLVLCQNFVRKNGGTFKIKCIVCEVSTFYFDLPIGINIMA